MMTLAVEPSKKRFTGEDLRMMNSVELLSTIGSQKKVPSPVFNDETGLFFSKNLGKAAGTNALPDFNAYAWNDYRAYPVI